MGGLLGTRALRGNRQPVRTLALAGTTMAAANITPGMMFDAIMAQQHSGCGKEMSRGEVRAQRGGVDRLLVHGEANLEAKGLERAKPRQRAGERREIVPRLRAAGARVVAAEERGFATVSPLLCPPCHRHLDELQELVQAQRGVLVGAKALVGEQLRAEAGGRATGDDADNRHQHQHHQLSVRSGSERRDP